MKNFNNKFINKFLILVMVSVLSISCSFEEQIDPNGPSIEGFTTGASLNQLNNLVVGIESTMRNGLGVMTVSSGSLARELYIFDADPRNTEVLLGKNGSTLSNGDFYAVSPWSGSYRAIKNANVLIASVENTELISSAQKNAYLGFAKTVIAYELIEVLKTYGKARVDVADESNLGPILDFNVAISQIATMLNDAKTNLSNAGNEFPFKLAGFEDLDTPNSFIKFTNAVLGLTHVYAGNKPDAITALNSSYLDLSGDFLIGPKHVFSQAGGDTTNPIFKGASTVAKPNNGDQIIVHNSWINDAEAGDLRVSQKTAVRPDPTSQDGLTGTHETRLYASNISPIHILRNEELILLYAEAYIGSNNSEAIRAINVIRNEFGLADYSGATDDASVVKELLVQRRYSLWCENHRMFDLRRYNMSSDLPIDRAGDVVYNIFPIPFSENEN